MGSGRGNKRRVQATATATAVAPTKRSGTIVGWDFDPDHEKRANIDNMNFSYVTTPEQVEECRRGLAGATRIGFDIETTGLAPHQRCIRLMQFAVEDPEPKQWVVDCFAVDPSELMPALKDPEKEIVIHFARFEQEWLLYHHGVRFANLFDTYVASRELNKGTKTRNRLKDLSRRYVDKQMSKEQQASYWDAKKLSPHQVRYAALDAAILLDVMHPLKKDVVEAGLQKEVEKNTKVIYSRINAKINKKQEWRDDEYLRARRAINNAQTPGEVDQIEAFSRQLCLPYRRRDKVKVLLRSRREELALNAVAA